jgi:hypothetical protein
MTHSRESPFEKLIDVRIAHKNWSYVDQRTWWIHGGIGLEDWGIINLLQRFRHKKCTIRRDSIYSLLALAKGGKTIEVDYDLPEEKIMRQVLNVRESSICICSTAIVAHALAPWDFEAIKECERNAHFGELKIYVVALSSTACPFCAHWVPFSWTRKKGVVLCFETACPDTTGHLFWEPSDSIKTADEVDKLDRIHLELRQNNTSRLLCETGQSSTPLKAKKCICTSYVSLFERSLKLCWTTLGPATLVLMPVGICGQMSQSDKQLAGQGCR